MSHHHSLRKALGGLSLVVVLVLAACDTSSAPPTPPADTPTAEAGAPTIEPPPAAEAVEVLRLPGGGYWGHPSPFGFNRGPGYTRASLLFDTLVWRDASGETIPWLATDWSLSDDELTWTFTLRDGVRWQDGEPLTADDVVFSIEYYRTHPGTAWFMSQINEIASITKVSDNRVALTLVRPFAPFLQTTAES